LLPTSIALGPPPSSGSNSRRPPCANTRLRLSGAQPAGPASPSTFTTLPFMLNL
jgi:hypothetical protein